MSTPIATTATPVDAIIEDLIGGRRRRRSPRRSRRRSHRRSKGSLEHRMHSMFKGGDVEAEPTVEVSGGEVPEVAQTTEVAGGQTTEVAGGQTADIAGGRKVYTMSNGAKYIKLANGRPRIISGASARYMRSIRRRR